MNPRRIVAAMIGLCALAPLLGVGDDAVARAELEDARRGIQREMGEVRLRLLRERAELRELNERIESLQKILMNKLDSQPEMIALRKQLLAVETRLETPPENPQ